MGRTRLRGAGNRIVRRWCAKRRPVADPALKAFASLQDGDLGCGPMKKTALVSALFLAFVSVSNLYSQSADPLAPTLGVKSADQIDREWQQSVAKYDAERNRLLAEADRQAQRRTLPPRLGHADQVPAAAVVQGRQVRDLHSLGRVLGAGSGERVVPAQHVQPQGRAHTRTSASTSRTATSRRVTRT